MISSSIFYFDTSKVGSDSSKQFQKAFDCAIEKYEFKNMHVISEENFRIFCLKESIDKILYETSNEIDSHFCLFLSAREFFLFLCCMLSLPAI